MHTEGQECMKVLKRVDKDLSSLNGKATRRKAELVALEKTVQKQNKKRLKLMGRINSALERINELEDQAETCDRRIRNLEEEVEEPGLKMCRCKGKEREVVTPVEVKRGHRMCLQHSDLLLYRNPLVWSTRVPALTLKIWRT